MHCVSIAMQSDLVLCRWSMMLCNSVIGVVLIRNEQTPGGPQTLSVRSYVYVRHSTHIYF